MQKYQDEHDTNKSTGPDNLSAGLLKNSSSKDFSRLPALKTGSKLIGLKLQAYKLDVSSSFLGPILFLIFINDITRCSNVLNFLLYADDTNIFLKGNDLTELETTLNTELAHVAK